MSFHESVLNEIAELKARVDALEATATEPVKTVDPAPKPTPAPVAAAPKPAAAKP